MMHASPSATDRRHTRAQIVIARRRPLGLLAGVLLTATLSFAAPADAADVAVPENLPAAPPAPANNFAAGLSLGTLGLGAEFSAKITNALVLRLTGNGYAFSFSHEIQSDDFSLNASLVEAGLLADWHPFNNAFRLSAGPTFQDFRAAGSAAAQNGTITINGNPYQVSQIGTLHASVSDNLFGGYFGLGYDAIHFAEGRFGISFDVGGIYAGSPKISLTTTGSAPGLSTDLAAEQSSIQNAARYFCVYPVLAVTAKYGF